MKSQKHGSVFFENQNYSLDAGSRREDGGDVRNKEGAWIQVFFGLVETFKEFTHWTNFSMLVTAILGLLAPLAAYTSYYFIFAILVAQVVFSQINFFWLQMNCSFIIIYHFIHVFRWLDMYLGSVWGSHISIPQPPYIKMGSESRKKQVKMFNDCQTKQAHIYNKIFLRTIGRTQIPVCLLLQVYVVCFPWRDSWDRSDAAFVWNSP